MYRIAIVLAMVFGLWVVGPELGVRSAGAEESASAPDAKAVALKAYQRGTAYYQQKEYDLAIEQFEAGYQAVPQAVFIYNIAQSHRLAGRPDRALPLYRQYLQLSPDAKNRAECEERIATLEKQLKPAPKLEVPSNVPDIEPAPAGQLTPAEERQRAEQELKKKRRRTAGIAIGVISGILVAGAAIGLGLYFGLPQPPQPTVFQPVTP